ncbi:MAG: SLC13 family permease [Mariniblastus sp.]|nr:SLC13 family permease [Mariniblastus sp.]
MLKASTIFLGPVLAVIVGGVLWSNGLSGEMVSTASITILVAVWWITEPIPIPATSLIPLALFPLFGVLTTKQVAAAYGNWLILLMLGGFMLSAGLEKSGAHRRIALWMVNIFGGSSGRRLVFGFMAASAILSMWISNAATCLMLLPIAMAVVRQSECEKFKVALLLGIAYAASVGGIGTPIGTPPNLVFMDNYEKITGGSEISFVQWMFWVLPIVGVMLPVVGFWLTRKLSGVETLTLPQVGKWRREEVLALIVFALTAFCWITRSQPWGGWKTWLNLPEAKDSSVALLGAVSLFLVPNGKGGKLLDWKTAKNIPWSILVLFAGGICIAEAFKSSGLSTELATAVAGFGALPVLILMGGVCLVVTFLTEVTSNTATTTLLMPILAAAAVGAEMNPLIIMVPATISASFAFMLPVATPPNAIVFGSEKLTIREMAREGLILNLLGVVVVTAICYWLFGR